MPKTEFEQKLHDEQLAARRCAAALSKVDEAARRRIVAWLADTYGPSHTAEPESDQPS